MQIVQRPINHHDDRGMIVDVFPRGGPDCVTLITSTTTSTRGNHVHDRSTQHLFVISGVLWTYHRRAGERVHVDLLERYDLATHEPGEEHAYFALAPTSFLALAAGVRQGDSYEEDTRRVPSLHEEWIAQGRLSCMAAATAALDRVAARLGCIPDNRARMIDDWLTTWFA